MVHKAIYTIYIGTLTHPDLICSTLSITVSRLLKRKGKTTKRKKGKKGEKEKKRGGIWGEKKGIIVKKRKNILILFPCFIYIYDRKKQGRISKNFKGGGGGFIWFAKIKNHD